MAMHKTHCVENCLLFNSHSLKVVHINIRSLRKNFDALDNFVCNHSFDIICVSETFLYPDEHFCYDIEKIFLS